MTGFGSRAQLMKSTRYIWVIATPSLKGQAWDIFSLSFIGELDCVPPLDYVAPPYRPSCGRECWTSGRWEGDLNIKPATEERRENKDKRQECRSFLGHSHEILNYLCPKG